MLPESEKFPAIPGLDEESDEYKALGQALRHMVPVGDDWDYYLLVERATEWEPALKTPPPHRLVTRRYIEDELYFLKGCHLLTGPGSLEKVLQRLANHQDSDSELDDKLKGWIVLQVDISMVKGAFDIPVMAEVLRSSSTDWDNTIHPHIFGPLPLAAVMRTTPVQRNTSGGGERVTIGQFTDFVKEEAAI